MSQNSPALPKFEVPITVNGTTNKNWYFFFQSLISTTISSVGLDSVDLTVNGSPLVASGVINANLKIQPGVSAGFYPAANVTVNSKGIVTAITSGGGSGGAFVSSVTLTSTDLMVAGSPALGPNVLMDLELATQSGVAAGSYAYASLTVNAKGVITAVSSATAVTSVGLTSTDLTVSGSPVTSAGNITADLATQAGVTPGSYTLANVTVNSKGVVTAITSGGGAATITVTDGVTTLTGITTVDFTSGGTVTSGGSGIADVAIAGGGGSGGPFNVTADTHTSTPTFVANDEFEAGTTIDTAGTRFSGATPWTAFNATGLSTSVADGALLLINNSNSSALSAGYSQPLVGTTWAYACKMAVFDSAGSPLTGIAVSTASGASGNISVLGVSSGTGFVVQHLTNATSFSANAFVGGTAPNPIGLSNSTAYVYLKIFFDGTNINYQVSVTGIAGSYITIFSETPGAFIGTPALVSLSIGSPVVGRGVYDWFRKTL